jgi:hypothetical protein
VVGVSVLDLDKPNNMLFVFYQAVHLSVLSYTMLVVGLR